MATAGDAQPRFLWGANAHLDLRAEAASEGSARLRNRSVLIAVSDQIAALRAAIELDGLARRLVLCPPGLPADHLRHAAATAAVDTVISDLAEAGDAALEAASRRHDDPPAAEAGATEWILLTSGTTGMPKLVVHTLATLTGAIRPASSSTDPIVWSTFYDVRRYGGLQIALRALLGTGSMVLSDAQETTADFLLRAADHRVTHLSGTPTHWRRALMSPQARAIAPQYVRLSGEIADQALLDQLAACYPRARIAHAFASTEAGVAFEVGDGRAGFPAALIGQHDGGVQMKIEDDTLHIRSSRTGLRYLGTGAPALADEAGFVDTGDVVELRDDRFHFVGRRGGVINVGGLKVHPEEIEAVINRHPGVRMSLVRARKNPITGAVVSADIVPAAAFATVAEGDASAALRDDILTACRGVLAPHKVPAVIRFVPTLSVAASGKVARFHV
jgi:acyl-coenzyme A synthetase/AMP-(fatty) acid ligase